MPDVRVDCTGAQVRLGVAPVCVGPRASGNRWRVDVELPHSRGMLRPCADLSPADWITRSEATWTSLALFGPDVFDAYARLRFEPDPSSERQSLHNELPFADPAHADGECAIVARACEALAVATSTPDECYFAIWAGYADVVPPVPGRPGMSEFSISHRTYYLYRGVVSDAWGWVAPRSPRFRDPPAFVWPADRAWCLAADVDPHWAGVGARSDVIRRLTARDDVDVVLADRDGRQPFYD